MPKVLFLTTSHSYNDDRIFYHQAKALRDNGYEVKICSLHAEYKGFIDGIEIESYAVLEESIDHKMQTFRKVCNDFQPQCIICSEPLAIVAVRNFVKENKISCIYDVTEWYPSLSMLQKYRFPAKIFQTVKFSLIQLCAGFLSTHFIFGETTKKFPLAYFFGFKKQMILPYYPDSIYIKESIKQLDTDTITLCYTGQISKDKGIENFFSTIDKLRQKMPTLHIRILIIGSTVDGDDEIYFSALLKQYSFDHIEIRKPTAFERFTESLAEADICFDLREINFENNHSLPIKLFYFMGAGKPVIYSDLKGIRKHLGILSFGSLVDPHHAEFISEIIINYIRNPESYHAHALNARKEFKEQYNWDRIKVSFVDFVKRSIDK
ncbi:glycosyltransferase [Chryseobacterium culicis]|uniref:Glycosyl transferase family 1 n=1 Tax=Chryseobacterium culicis TaxID=680127 RepID=A0A2S9CKU7_CHRCI|nr:glycosyltransferase [Chryseobacterium culicis]PRB81142.1 glycosyl transferase family 1 [Chryseobacterium culicis]PRB88078.1 glycosyl transferase family 1 [Chryseobacterium culicis]